MTARELFRLLLRRWYLMLLGAAMSVGALYVATHQPGVYWTQFNGAAGADRRYYPNNLADPHYALAPMAGVLATDWNQDHARWSRRRAIRRYSARASDRVSRFACQTKAINGDRSTSRPTSTSKL
jgi:hypothetical protein